MWDWVGEATKCLACGLTCHVSMGLLPQELEAPRIPECSWDQTRGR